MLEIPPNFPPLKTLAASHERQSKAHKAAKAELRELEAELVTAAEKDRRAFADRLAKDVDAKNPGEREQEKVRAKITGTKARRDALADTVSDVEQAIDDEIKANYEKWLATETATLEKTRRAFMDAIEALAVKVDELAAQEILVGWLRAPGRPYKARPLQVHSRALLKVNGSQRSVAELLDALRETAKPPDQREELYPPPRISGPPAMETELGLDRVA